MFSVIFPGQGSQIVGMGKELYAKFDTVKKLFNEADKILEFSISSLILEGPKDQLDLTENTQPAIFLVGYSIFQLLKKEFELDLNKANFFAGHSLGEYTALASADVLSFSSTLKLLKIRGNGKIIKELEKNESIDQNLLRYLTVKVKKFDLEANYFSKNDEREKKKSNKN